MAGDGRKALFGEVWGGGSKGFVDEVCGGGSKGHFSEGGRCVLFWRVGSKGDKLISEMCGGGRSGGFSEVRGGGGGWCR